MCARLLVYVCGAGYEMGGPTKATLDGGTLVHRIFHLWSLLSKIQSHKYTIRDLYRLPDQTLGFI